MSALIPVDINGVQHQAHGEYTSAAVAQQFQGSLAAFLNVFNVGQPASSIAPDASDISAELNDEQYGVFLKNALNGGSLKVNYELGVGDDVAVLGLFNLAKDGLLVENDPVLRPGTHFLSLEMAGALQQLVKSLQMAGVNIQDDGTGKLQVVGDITTTMVKTWKNLANSSDAIRQILQHAIDTSGNQNRTLQALVELIYVRTGNELLSENLEILEGAISSTKDSLDALSRLQVLHNKITAEEKEKFDQVFWGFSNLIITLRRATLTQYPIAPTLRNTMEAPFLIVISGAANAAEFMRGTGVLRIQNVLRVTIDPDFSAGKLVTTIIILSRPGFGSGASEHFNAIDPTLLDQITESDRIEFMALRRKIIEELPILEAQTPADQREGSLFDRLGNVLEDINKAFIAVGIPSTGIDTNIDINAGGTLVTSALTRWILDSQLTDNTALNISGLDSGSIQRNLTTAISAGQSLNDTQKEEVRRYLFVFEEYYKSAAAILSKITQILERMAQAIGR